MLASVSLLPRRQSRLELHKSKVRWAARKHWPGHPLEFSQNLAEVPAMCRNIKTLFNFDPPVTPEEIKNASLQFVRKISGFNKRSRANEASFLLSTKKPGSLPGSFTPSKRTHHRGIEKNKRQRLKLAPWKESHSSPPS